MSKNTNAISLRLILPALLLSVITASLVTPVFAKKHHGDKTAVAITNQTQFATEQSTKRSGKKEKVTKDGAFPNVPEVGDSGMDILAD